MFSSAALDSKLFLKLFGVHVLHFLQCSSDMKPRPFYRKVAMKVLIRLTTFFFLRTPFQGENYTKIKIHKMTVSTIFIQCIKKYNKEENTQDDKGGFIKINNRNSRQGFFSFGRSSEKCETTQ